MTELTPWSKHNYRDFWSLIERRCWLSLSLCLSVHWQQCGQWVGLGWMEYVDDDERIGMVLVRASDLRSKIIIANTRGGEKEDDDAEEEDHETGAAESLFSICDALESLESQLASLQALQQQQQYEREAAIGEIEYSRKQLLNKLQEYKGEHLDVIHEATAFASMKVEHNNELLLPPYPTHAPHSLILDNTHLSHFPFTRKPTPNGHGSTQTSYDLKSTPDASDQVDQAGATSSSSWKLLKRCMYEAAKTILPVVGIITVLGFTGYEPRVEKTGNKLNLLGLFQQPHMKEKMIGSQCPPGKVAVVEDGEVRCIVKERVEIPFTSVASKPDVTYGCG